MATPTPWETQSYDEGENGIAIIGLPVGGLVAWASLSPTELDANDPTRAEANAALIVEAVNNYASLKARIEELESVLRAVNEVDAHGFAVAPMSADLRKRVQDALEAKHD